MTGDTGEQSVQSRVLERVANLELDRVDYATLSLTALVFVTLVVVPLIGLSNSTTVLTLWAATSVVLAGVTLVCLLLYYVGYPPLGGDGTEDDDTE